MQYWKQDQNGKNVTNFDNKPLPLRYHLIDPFKKKKSIFEMFMES